MNINTVCDRPGDHGAADVGGNFTTECPAPKAALRRGALKLLVECYNSSSHSFVGRRELYNVTADPSEQHDLSSSMPDALSKLSSRLLVFGAQAGRVTPLSNAPPWQGDAYWCATCRVGHPAGPDRAWLPWCEGAAGVACPLPAP